MEDSVIVLKDIRELNTVLEKTKRDHGDKYAKLSIRYTHADLHRCYPPKQSHDWKRKVHPMTWVAPVDSSGECRQNPISD